MSTIVEYDSRKEPLNAYPERIVSPFQPDSCCADHMMQVVREAHDLHTR